MPPGGGDGKPPIGPDGMPGIGPPRAAIAAGIAPGGPGIAPGNATGRGPANAGGGDAAWGSALPQLRQNFMPAGFSPRHTAQIDVPGNPGAGS
jgi:hypothetical protein